QLLAASTVRIAGALPVRRLDISPIFVKRDVFVDADLGRDRVLVIDPGPPLPASLPLVSSQQGNRFVDRNDPNLNWYLPDFNLADDVDAGFAFAASQSGKGDINGNPLNNARLTLRMHKSIPDDIAQFAQANPAAKLQEIPLADLSAILISI